MNEKIFWILLSMVFGGGNNRLWQLMNIFESAEEAYNSISRNGSIFKLNNHERENLLSYSISDAKKFLAECEKKNIGVVAYSEREYPGQLRFILDPPAVLYYKGDISCLHCTKTITAVGTRNPGNYSLNAAEKICSALAEQDFVIVSGFAVGIDIASHLAAVSVNRPTACVLGCGVDVDYPKENFRFRDNIINSGGVFISEYPPGTSPSPKNFPKRNRILSALGRSVMVFEAASNSGSLITADLALEQGKEIFVLPPSDIFSKRFFGNSRLLREGALPLIGVEDVVNFFKKGSFVDAEIRADAFSIILDAENRSRMSSFHFPIINGIISPESYSPEKIRASFQNEESHDEIMPEAEKTPDDNEKKESEKAEKIPDIPEGIQQDIFMLLKNEGRLHADVICVKLDISSDELMTEITELEIIGAVKACPGRIYEIK